MGSSRSLLIFILPFLLNLISPTTAQDDGICTNTAYYCWKCSDTGMYTPGDMYQENLNSLLSSFSTNTEISSGFYNFSKGRDPNKVNAIALCRGDLSQDTCHTCLNRSTDILLQNCSRQKEAIIWAEPCMVRYSNNLIFRIEKEDPVKCVPSPNPAKNSQQFELVLNPLLSSLSEKAASGDSIRKFAAGHATVPGDETIYALVQCTPDINQQNCSNCLKEAVLDIPGCCGGMQGGRILKPSCNLRYEVSLFFESTASSPVNIPTPVPAAPAPKEAANKSNKKVIIIVVVLVILVAFVTVLSIYVYLRVKKRGVKLEGEDQENSDEISFAESLQYEFDTIRSATDDFSDANKLGRGGFGAVYKGRLLNGQLIAVKRLAKNSAQGDREFKNEVMLLAQLQHRNLVRLLGFCLKAEERLLIYEYVPNSSLDHFIFGPNSHMHLDWETRYKIIGGIARGILYLHEDSRVRIIHRDLKAGNILLDEDMNPKIADFGMARLFVIDQTQGYTKAIVGTYGYMAPEYVLHGNLSVKTDVFSFGVLVLEIVSGKKIGRFRYGENEEGLLSYAWRNWREDTISNVIDPMLTTSSRIETMRCIHIGLLCVQENAVDRPTAASVVSMLNSESVTLSAPSKPAFHMQKNGESDISGMTESDESKKLPIYVSKNEPSNITEPYPR
ncbi:cysteine-rich receptor-like protein kinase 29 [Pyrus ussuriensis x Pyrus communis]|uniref:Cysteine-rich receptor-like protein kinase 29 n=1 Tax=Pyrus ussuriensis x Pyrus communis TaxID=2448454 RepID=A0A5N5FD68_9ROSA|nr:cysteine-rich receptor-like protein kinase 29 [Pyrus ussuriensis x Pyrus communis]